MTHLSDFSYLQRIAQEVYLAAFLLIRMWQSKGFKCLSPRRLINGELRSIITWFMFLLLLAQASWDILCTYIKYTEGFMQVAPGVIISKPFVYWKPDNQNPIEVMNYIQCVTFSLQVSILLLLQCFWNYLSNAVAKHSFMGSKEFTIYIVWTLGSIAMFPVLNYFYKNTVLEEVVPQTAYACEILLVALLGFRNHTRFNRLIKVATENGKKSESHVIDRLSYFRDMNLLLSVDLIAFGGGIFILCIDGFTTNKVINSNKFAADLLICNANISSIFLWLIIIGIFHPARVAIDSKKLTTDRTGTHDTPGTAAPTISPYDNNVSKTGTLPAGRYVYGANKNNKQGYDMDSTKVLTKESDSEMELGYMSSSPPESINNMPPNTGTAGGGLSHPRHYYQQRNNVVSIDDPYGNEPISFSMINSKYSNDNNAMAYASAVDHHHAPNPYHLSSSAVSPAPSSSPPLPFSSPLPPPPPSSSSNQIHSSPSYVGIRSAAASPPPNQELPPIPLSSENTATDHDAELPWLDRSVDRSTSPGRR